MKKIYRILYIILITLLIAYIPLIIYAKKIQTIATFPATIYNVQDFKWHIELDLDYEEINIKNKDWININWLFVKANNRFKNQKTVYYFHWNWWPLSYFYNEIKYINDLWYNVIAYDYPWYWKSGWFPYKNLVDDFSDTFYKYIKWEKKIIDENLIIRWYSIWTAVAIDFASKNNHEKIVLISPLSSRYEMSKKLFGFPLQKILFLKESYDSKNLVKNFNKPILIIHWNRDKIVPFKQGKQVFNNYLWDKYFIEIDKMWHNYIIYSYWEILKNYIDNFLKKWNINWKDNYLFLRKT